ncbi:MAG: thiamine pyrophosphate-binding protein [Pirellulaceae bacterium]|nr:alpha-keto acid decarboxylase family protein [Planctomycetales bacterium]
MPTVAEYLSLRLIELGADHLFSIPGNYTAEFLLSAQAIGIDCVGTTNELEAGYAADSYARYRGIGVCCATYGVGSHSLYNAISGAYVEFCPVVLINGSPPPSKFENLKHRGILFAHAIDPIRTDAKIFEEVTVASAVICDPFEAPQEIDRVLGECVKTSRPVYIEVLQGIWSAECDAPKAPLSKSIQHGPIANSAADVAAKLIMEKIHHARRPVIWGGELLTRRKLVDLFRALVRQSGLPYTTTLMGKGLIAETEFADQFVGVYDSKFAPQDVRDVVEQSDCLLALGTIMSDFYADVVINSKDRMILASDDAVRIGPVLYPNVPLSLLLPRLIELLGAERPSSELTGLQVLTERRAAMSQDAMERPSDSPITYDNFFKTVGRFLTEEHTLLVDTSLALFPSADLTIKRQGGYVAQTAWLSIGYTCGATLGVATVDPATKVLAIVGDGGFQMLPQSFSTLAKRGCDAVVFVLDNGTYGIEQYLVDMQILPPPERFFQNRLPAASFFDVLPRWDYAKLGEAFGGQGITVSKLADLERFLHDPGRGPVLVGVSIDQHDLPAEIAATIPTAAENMRRNGTRAVALDAFD